MRSSVNDGLPWAVVFNPGSSCFFFQAEDGIRDLVSDWSSDVCSSDLGTSTIVSFPFSPSPGAANYLIAYAGPVLNEVMARNESATKDSAGRFPDWFELFNPTASRSEERRVGKDDIY